MTDNSSNNNHLDFNLLKSILDHSIQSYFLFDTNRELVFCNKTAEIFVEAYYGKNIFSQQNELWQYINNRNGVREMLNFGLTGNSFSQEVKLYTENTTSEWFEMNITPWYSPDKQEIKGVLLQLLGIRKRKLAEQQLEKSKNNLKAMFESSPQVYAMINSDGFVITHNRKTDYYYQKITGKKFDKNKCLIYLNDEIFDSVFVKLFKKSLEGKKLNRELLLKSFDGEQYWFEVHFVPVYDHDKTVFAISFTAIDITYRKKADESIRKSEKQLRELNISKDKFISILAHDLKSPIASLNSLSELLLNPSIELASKDLDEMHLMMNKTSQHALELLENLLMWSRSQSGGIVFKPRMINIQEVTDTTLNYLSTIAQQKEIECYSTIKANIEVFADPDMLATVIRNLISNALKFTSKGGRVVIGMELGARFAKIKVKDTGVGIPAHKINDLFTIETNFSTYGTMNEKGTGLGLLLCKEFVERNGGTISVSSVVNIGTEFLFTVPLFEKIST